MTANPTTRWWLPLTGVSLLAFVCYMDVTIVSIILPGIQRDLQASVGQLQWMMNAYFMMLTIFQVVAGRFGDIYGHRRLLYLGALLFAIATIFAGLAQSPGQLIAMRFLQGLAGAILNTVSAALITHIVPERHRGLALGIYTSVVGCGLAMGPVIGGLLLSLLSWRWAFYINVPVIAVGLLICWRSLAESPRQSHVRIDWPGLCLLIVAVATLLTALMEGEHWGWTSPAVLSLFAAAAVSTSSFIWVESRAAFPIIDLSLFRHRLFLISAIAVVGMGGFVALGNFLPPLYLQNVLNEPPYLVGLMLMSVSVLVVILPPLVGRLGDRIGHLPIIFFGLGTLVLSALVQAFLETTSPAWLILIGLGLFGAGWGVLQTTTSVTAISALPASASGLALGALWTVWDLSANICLAVGGFILETIDKSELLASLEPYNMEMSPFEHRAVSAMLSDPAEAHEILRAISPGLEAKVFPLFQESFTAGYNGAMLFMAAVAGFCLLAVMLLSWSGRDQAKPVN